MKSIPRRILTTSTLLMIGAIAASSCKLRRSSSTSNPAMDGFVSFNAQESDAIRANVDCQIKCKALPNRLHKIEAIYAPAHRGLRPGNGQMWGSMANDLESFASESCLSKAQSECGGLASVESLKIGPLASGKWNMNIPLGCQLERAVLSPFDPESGAITVAFLNREEAATPAFPKLSINGASKTCQRWIEAKTCYGDCLVEVKEGKWQQTVASSNPLATDQEKICGDALLTRLQIERITSADVQNLLCRQYFWENLVNQNKRNMALACAAYRAEVDCSAITGR